MPMGDEDVMSLGHGSVVRVESSLEPWCASPVYYRSVLPPILDIYVVCHPDDTEGVMVARWLLDHFQGTPYGGLVGGAVEVYVRSTPWTADADAPRPMPFQTPLPHGLPSARITAVVPILGGRLARATENPSSAWYDYLTGVKECAEESEDVGIFPVRLEGTVEGKLTKLLGDIQALHRASAEDPRVLCMELSQQIAQMIGDPLGDRMTVFVSHTKRHSPDEDKDWVDALIARVRSRISNTRLVPYFDESDLQPGSDWDTELRSNAASSALMAIRTDLYAGREWCQREFLIAKQAGMPVVTLNAVRSDGERGSFLMDHVPVVGYRDCDEETANQSIDDALSLLVDQALRRGLWHLHVPHLQSIGVTWAPPEAPEPVTAVPWLLENGTASGGDRMLMMHPDPPLGPSEMELMEQLFALATDGSTVDIVTPLTYVNRGGEGL